MDFLKEINPEIIWVFLGIVFIFIEFFIPGLVIAFFGAGALITALTTWIGLTPTLASQLLVFMVSSLLSLALLRKYVKNTFLGMSKDGKGQWNFNIEVGKIVPVIEMIEPGEVGGKVRYQGSPWTAKANERIAPGESVRIKGIDNLTLLVERIENVENIEKNNNQEVK